MEQDALNRWLEKRKTSQEPDEEFLELLAEVLREPSLVASR